jgi:CBS domain-containing protein
MVRPFLPVSGKHDNNDKLVGIISDRDILEAIGKSKIEVVLEVSL